MIAPGPVEINVAASSKNGIAKLEFYFDDQLVSRKSHSYRGDDSYRIFPAKISDNATHTISVIAI